MVSDWFLLLVCCILMAIIFFLLNIIYIRRMRLNMRMHEHKLLLKYQNLFDSMPIPYIQCQIIEDNGFIDVMVLDANQAFSDKIIPKSLIWHKNRKDIENTAIGSIEKYLEVARKVLKTKEAYLTEFKINQCIYNIIITTSDEENVIDTFLIDITELIQLEQSLREALNKAEEANKLKSSFLANISHEIRTPLNAIIGFSSMLPTAESDEEANEYLSIIRSNNGLLLQLIDDILDLAKIEAGTLDFSKTTFSVNDLMDQVIHSARLGLDNDKVEMLCYKQEVDYQIHSCRNRIMQVLINLVNN